MPTDVEEPKCLEAASSFVREKTIIIVGAFPRSIKGGIPNYCNWILHSKLSKHFRLIPFDSQAGEAYLKMRNRSSMTFSRGWEFLKPCNWRFVLWALYSPFSLAGLCLKEKPSAIHVHTASFYNFFRNALYLLVAKRLRIPSILHMHNDMLTFYWHPKRTPWIRWLIRKTLSLPAVIVTLSANMRDKTSKITQRSVIVIENAYLPSSINGNAHQDPPRCICKERFTILTVVSDLVRKGVPDLLKALSLMNDSIKSRTKLIVAGNDTHGIAKSCTKALNIASYVQLKGYVTGIDLDELYARSTLFVLPSYSENQPAVLLQAMAFGCAIITTPVGSIPEIIHPRGGEMVPPGDVETLARTLEKWLSDPERCRRAEKVNRVLGRSRFNAERLLNDHRRLYGEIASGFYG